MTEIVDAWVIGAHLIPPDVASTDLAGEVGNVLVMHRATEEADASFEILPIEEFDAEYEWTTDEEGSA